MPSAHADDHVLDIEKRRLVPVAGAPEKTTLTCDVLIVGGGVGGVAAAQAAIEHGLRVVMTEPTGQIGGQFTSQMVCPPDENSHIEKAPGPSTFRYRMLRENVREHYRQQPGVKQNAANNIGACWVSRLSGLPQVWEQAMQAPLKEAIATGRLTLFTRHQLHQVARLNNGRVNWADVADLETGKTTRIACKFLLDATEDGDALERSRATTTLGQEAKAEYNEPHAPEAAQPGWIQSFTYCFLVQWRGDSRVPTVPKPAEYDYFKSLGEYTLDYVYSDARGVVPYKVFEKAPNAAGPFWTYRRLVAAASFENGQPPEGDIALINWRGNDFHEESYVGKPLTEQVRILERGRAFSQGFLYWLQNECPRDDGKGVGYPEMTLYGDFAPHPYIRESRRLKAQVMLTENHLLATPDSPGAKWGTEFEDSVGCALYAVDIHPSKGEPPLLTPALPYHLPLGAFLPASGPANLLPASKNFGATRLALASARMHPTEWLVGEVAGHLAAFCVRRGIADPATVRNTPALLSEFRGNLKEQGITLHWRDILTP